MTHSIVPPTSASSPVSPVPPPPSAPWLEAQGWRRLSGALRPGELETLGFLAASEAAAQAGAWLVPLLWHTGERVAIRSHRLLLDDGGRHEPSKGPRLPVLGALGALRTDLGAWTSPARPLLLVEGDAAAAAVAAALPEALVVSYPEPSSPPWGRRALSDAKPLALRGRTVLLALPKGAPRSSELELLLGGLEARGARVASAGGLPGDSEGHALGPDQRPRFEAWLASALAPPPRPAPAPPSPGTRLRDLLPESFWSGPEALQLPAPYRLLDEPGSPLVLEQKGRDKLVAHEALWPVGQVEDPPGHLLLSAIVQTEGRFLLRPVLLARRALYDARELSSQLADHGVNIPPEAPERVASYLSLFVRRNPLPLREVQTTAGWDAARKIFYYGKEPLGGEGSMVGLVHDEATRMLFGSLGRVGDGAVWRATAEAMLAVSPDSALVLAASIASPMLRLFGWPTIGVLFGALGGKGKSTMLRLAATVFGTSGGLGAFQAAGVVGKADGSPKGLLLQFRRFADFPHLADELKPSSFDPRQREEVASVLHQIFEGQEYVRATRASNGSLVGKPFAGCTVVAGEVAASDFLRKGGVIRRFLPPPGPFSLDDSPLGRFTEALESNHGHLGRALCEALVQTTPAQRQEMARRHALYLEGLAMGDNPPEPLRSWSGQIATALAAVDVCAQLCPALCPHPTAWKTAIHAAWQQIVAAHAGSAASDVLGLVEEKLRGWVAKMRYHLQPSRALRHKLELRGTLDDRERLLLVPREPSIGQVAEAEQEGEADELLLKVDVFQGALTKFLADEGYSEGTLTRALADRGFFETTEGQSRQGAVGRNVRVNGTVTRVYRLVLATPTPSSQRAA